MTRLYATSGEAHFYCVGHPIHNDANKACRRQGDCTEHDHPDGEGHHLIVFVWVPECVHIDDHETQVLKGCDRGCTDYVLVHGDDPRDEKHLKQEVE